MAASAIIALNLTSSLFFYFFKKCNTYQNENKAVAKFQVNNPLLP
jgi:hypothetical protein